MKLKVILICTFMLCIASVHSKRKPQYEDNDFAEFEEFDEEASTARPEKNTEEHVISKGGKTSEKIVQATVNEDSKKTLYKDEDEDEALVEDETDEFSHLADEEEFIGFNSDKVMDGGKPSKTGEPKINIAKVPLHLRSNWDSFYLEMIMVLGLIAYFANYMLGKTKNQKIASAWFSSQKSILENNFALVGDDGKNEIEIHGLRKESENIYILWCSGRLMMEGMLVELRLQKRQDILSVLSNMIRPSSDQMIIQIKLDEMDPFVFALSTKKSASKVLKEMTDICTYCPEKKTGDKFNLNPQYVVHSELNEITTTFIRDPKVMAVMNKYPGTLEYMHFSDQFSGPKQPEGVDGKESTPAAKPEVTKTLTFAFNFDGNAKLTSDSFESMNPHMQLALYLSDKIARLRLSKEMKNRADKNRSKVEEAFLKASHAARAEMAQQMREEKKRQERERIMNLDDPEKQRKWEEKEQKRQMKKKQPKMKAMKVKPM